MIRLFRRRGGTVPDPPSLESDERRGTLSPGGLDYDRIAQLERELGVGDQEPERPIRRAPTVCLSKDCGGDTDEIRTWSGVLVARIHRCD